MRRTRRRIGRALTFLILCVVVVVMLFPFLFMVLTAFKSKDQYVSGTGFSLDGWAELFKFLPVVQELVNSAVVTAGAVLLIIAVSTTGGFAFAKLGFRGAGVVFLGILAGMMIPMQSIIIPEFVNIARVAHLNNQYLGAILVYAALGAPIATYLMTTYYRGIPSELVEASVMDGASYWQVFRKVMLPLSVPAITTIAVLQFIQIWDDLLVGLLFLNEPHVRTITVGLAVIQTGRVVNVPALMAGSLLSALPAIVVYLIFQRNLIQGLTMGVNK
jgi:multiple sugar transport system permease protein/raffinose/stachyose/melibiose transport system permease protein